MRFSRNATGAVNETAVRESEPGSAACRPVSSGAAHRVRQFFNLLQRHVRDAGHDKLGDAVAVFDSKRGSRAEGPHGDIDFAPVIRVQSAEYEIDASPAEATAGAYLQVVARWRLDGDAGGHQRDVRAEFHGCIEAGVEIEAGGPGRGALGELRARPEEFYLEDGHGEDSFPESSVFTTSCDLNRGAVEHNCLLRR